jgi:hypothetical protein
MSFPMACMHYTVISATFLSLNGSYTSEILGISKSQILESRSIEPSRR